MATYQRGLLVCIVWHVAEFDARYVIPAKWIRGLVTRMGVASMTNMKEALAELLQRLLIVRESHGELCDTEVRERLDAVIHDGFLNPKPGYCLPVDFAMKSTEGNRLVSESLASFITAASAAAEAEDLGTFHERLDAFQDLDVQVGPKGFCYNDFFGWTDPRRFDADGLLKSR